MHECKYCKKKFKHYEVRRDVSQDVYRCPKCNAVLKVREVEKRRYS